MKHNGVISLASDGVSTYTAGQLVSVGAAGVSGAGGAYAVANGGTGDAIGVVLHDVKATETGRPIDIQLFSAGGIANCQKAAAAGGLIGAEVGYDDNDTTVGAGGTHKIGYFLEQSVSTSSGSTVQVVLK